MKLPYKANQNLIVVQNFPAVKSDLLSTLNVYTHVSVHGMTTQHCTPRLLSANHIIMMYICSYRYMALCILCFLISRNINVYHIPISICGNVHAYSVMYNICINGYAM